MYTDMLSMNISPIDTVKLWQVNDLCKTKQALKHGR